MKKSVKIVSLLLCLAALLSLAACGGKGPRSDVPALDIAENIVKAIDLHPDDMMTLEESYIKGRMELDLSGCDEYDVRLNKFSTSVDEFGVFKAKDEAAAKALGEQVQTYLDNRLATWMDEYMPEEKPKVENAQVKVEGVYVCYTILSDSASKAAFSTLEDAIG